ncbi:MAG: hypothetical protein HFI77_02100 [Lachnospiraceae bacterium]|nr:hypothetical protein [Lachnospiraceae bacterium]
MEKGVVSLSDLSPEQPGIYLWQGDYGLFQCSVPCRKMTYDNEDLIRKMVEARGMKSGKTGN